MTAEYSSCNNECSCKVPRINEDFFDLSRYDLDKVDERDIIVLKSICTAIDYLYDNLNAQLEHGLCIENTYEEDFWGMQIQFKSLKSYRSDNSGVQHIVNRIINEYIRLMRHELFKSDVLPDPEIYNEPVYLIATNYDPLTLPTQFNATEATFKCIFYNDNDFIVTLETIPLKNSIINTFEPSDIVLTMIQHIHNMVDNSASEFALSSMNDSLSYANIILNHLKMHLQMFVSCSYIENSEVEQQLSILHEKLQKLNISDKVGKNEESIRNKVIKSNYNQQVDAGQSTYSIIYFSHLDWTYKMETRPIIEHQEENCEKYNNISDNYQSNQDSASYAESYY